MRGFRCARLSFVRFFSVHRALPRESTRACPLEANFFQGGLVSYRDTLAPLLPHSCRTLAPLSPHSCSTLAPLSLHSCPTLAPLLPHSCPTQAQLKPPRPPTHQPTSPARQPSPPAHQPTGPPAQPTSPPGQPTSPLLPQSCPTQNLKIRRALVAQRRVREVEKSANNDQ